MEGSGHLPAASATASAAATASATGTYCSPLIATQDGGFWNPKFVTTSSTAFPDIGSSFQEFAAKLLPESVSQAAVDVFCQIGQDGLMIFDSASADQMLRICSLQNIARCDVVDSSVFELWTNNTSDSDAQPMRIRLQSDRAGDLLDAVTAAAMELLGFTNWMYLIKYGCEEDDSMVNMPVYLRYVGGPRENVVAGAQIPRIRSPPAGNIEMQERIIMGKWCAPVIPPYNSAATDPKDVYPLGKIIRAGEWRYLRDIIELMERGEEVKCGRYNQPYPPYVGSRLRVLWGTKDEAGRAKLGCLLSYITHLFKFSKLHYGYYSSVGEANIPPVLLRRFSDLFIVPETGLLNSIFVESYLFVLCLFVDNFRSCCSGSLPLVKSPGIDVRVICKRLGCKLSKREGRLVIEYELCTPLELPTERFGGIFREWAMKMEMERRRRRRKRKNDSKNIEQEQKRKNDGSGLNETMQPPQQPGHDGVI